MKQASDTAKHSGNKSLFDYEGRPPLKKTIPVSLQHIMAMFVGTVSVPVVVASNSGVPDAEKAALIQMSLLLAAVATLIQLFPIRSVGARLPIVYSPGFTYVPTLIVIGKSYGISGVLGAALLAGILTVLLSFVIGRVRRFFPPVVTGTIILTIGLSLYPIAIKYMAGGATSASYGSTQNWLVAGVTMVAALLFTLFVKGYLRLAGMMGGVVIGYLLSICLGMVNFSGVAAAPWVAFSLPFAFGMTFHAGAVLPIVLITVVNMIQSLGDISGTAFGGFNREPSSEELAHGVRGSGCVTILGSIMGAMPVSSYSQNVGIVSMTKVVSRRVLTFSACILLVLGLSPKFSALVSTIPYSVIGGATIMVFGMITLTGIKLLKDDLTARNTTIVGTSVALGMGVCMVPECVSGFPASIQPYLAEPVIMAGLLCFFLNLLVPDKSAEQEAAERAAMDDGQ